MMRPKLDLNADNIVECESCGREFADDCGFYDVDAQLFFCDADCSQDLAELCAEHNQERGPVGRDTSQDWAEHQRLHSRVSR